MLATSSAPRMLPRTWDLGVGPADVTSTAGARSHWPRHGLRSQRRVLVARRLARRSEPRPQLIADPLRAEQPAREVVADVGDDRRPRRRRQQRVERGDAVRLGRRHGEPLRDVVERAATDPALARRRGLERREQQVASRPRVVPAVGDVALGRDVASAAVPAAPARARSPGRAPRRSRRAPQGWLPARRRGGPSARVYASRRARSRGRAEAGTGGARPGGGDRVPPRGGWRAGLPARQSGCRTRPQPPSRCGPCLGAPAKEPLTPMPHLNRGLRLVVVAAAVAVVAANVLIRTPATPVAGGPSTDAAIDAWFDAERRDAGIPGAAVVVVRDGVVHAAGFGTADASGRPVDARTPFLLGSVSKGITALAVAQLAERGAIDLDSPVRRYLPEFALADPHASARHHRPPAARPDQRDPDRRRDRAALGARNDARRSRPGPGDRGAGVRSGRRLPLLERQLRRARPARRGRSRASRSRRISRRTCSSRWRWTTRRPIPRPRLPTASAMPTACGSGWRTRTARSTGRTSRRRGSSSAGADDVGRTSPRSSIRQAPGGGTVASAATVRAMFAGVAPTGVGDERYGLGWAETTYRGERIVAHAGSTTDMASFVAIDPARGVAVAVLFDAQSPLYELLHKPDQIGLGVLSMAAGRGARRHARGLLPDRGHRAGGHHRPHGLAARRAGPVAQDRGRRRTPATMVDAATPRSAGSPSAATWTSSSRSPSC